MCSIWMFFNGFSFWLKCDTVKLGNKERFDKEQIGIKELFIYLW